MTTGLLPYNFYMSVSYRLQIHILFLTMSATFFINTRELFCSSLFPQPLELYYSLALFISWIMVLQTRCCDFSSCTTNWSLFPSSCLFIYFSIFPSLGNSSIVKSVCSGDNLIYVVPLVINHVWFITKSYPQFTLSMR